MRCRGRPPGPDQQFLRFDIEAFSSNETFEFPDSADALLLTELERRRSGRQLVHDLVAYPECGDGAGAHQRARRRPARMRARRVVVRAPKPATTLRLSWLELMWEWPIPGSD